MKFSMFSVVVGDNACMAKCPFCVSGEKPEGKNIKLEPISENAWKNFKTACLLADRSGVQTMMLTSRGETTLYMEEITQYLENTPRNTFPFIELQTNGIALYNRLFKFWNRQVQNEELLKYWRQLGLNIISISTVSNKADINKQVYTPKEENYYDLPELINKLHNIGFTIRLTCIMCADWMNKPSLVEEFLQFAKDNNVEQVTMRPVNEEYRRESANQWIKQNSLSEKDKDDIQQWLCENGTVLYEIPKIGTIYDIKGQNCMFSVPLNKHTKNTDAEHARNLIFFRDGRIRHEWEKEGAILL